MYTSWYREVRAVKTLEVVLDNWTQGVGERPYVSASFKLSCLERGALRVSYITVALYQGPSLIREVTFSYPQALTISDDYSLSTRLDLPLSADPNCLKTRACYFRVEVGVLSKFGIVPITFTLKP
ncbi:hypothetical protein IG193_00840 [Infirmifilum lucidum]|uniref:Uncharacterized protein n=1 Tax=Infirmifilum lucidum TaxID=2776706 RepID=A0A7L9FJS8_9CREN|nr:hypothetical protein [Infirmifilum lucidum]QOJ79045.1 hypothetical protein IG193_00840 [Infirmifilum lucidum]